MTNWDLGFGHCLVIGIWLFLPPPATGDNVASADDAKLVQLNTLKAHGVAVNESGL